MDSENLKSDNKDEKVDIVSEDLLNPFRNVKKNTKDKKELTSEKVKIDKKNENVKQETYKANNNDENKELNKINDFNSNNDSDNLYLDNDEDDFYSNFNVDDKIENKKENKVNVLYSDDEKPDRKSSVIFIILAFIGFCLEFLNGIYVIIGFIICLISLIGSIVMYRYLAKYALLSMIMSFILVVVSILMFVFSYKSMNEMFNNAKDSISSSNITSNAISFVNAATIDVYANKTVSCDDNNKQVKYFIKDLIRLIDNYDNSILKLNEEESFVLVEAVLENERCNLKKYVYLTGENYRFGTVDNPILDKDIYITKPIKK